MQRSHDNNKELHVKVSINRNIVEFIEKGEIFKPIMQLMIK